MKLIFAALLIGLTVSPVAIAQVGSSSTATAAATPPKPKRQPLPKKKARPEPPPPAVLIEPKQTLDVDAVTPNPGGGASLRAPRVDPDPPPVAAPKQAESPEEEVESPPLGDWQMFDSPRLERVRSPGGTAPLLLILLLLIASARLASIMRRQFEEQSVLSRMANALNKLSRVLAGALVLFLLVAWLPADALPFVLLAAALAIGWSTRDVLPDLIAGVVIAFERRVKPGVWLSGDGFAGVVERVGLRATWLRDDTNRRVAVPNRALVSTPLTSEEGRWPTREVTIRMATDLPAETIRRAIVDAVLMSPFTPVPEAPSVRRDGSDPVVWHVRARVLDLSFAPRFEGELLERAEAILEFERRTREQTNPS